MTCLKHLCPYLLLLGVAARLVASLHGQQKLVLLFVDGLRHDLFGETNLPGFQELFDSGTRVRHLKPVFPSLCYPNYYTMMTGLYPENHGLIGNNIYDPLTKDFFRSRHDPEKHAADHWWERAEPLWVTAEKQRKASYLYYLSGCDRPINGHRPKFCIKVRSDMSLAEVVESLQHGLSKMEEGKADFVGLYYGELDTLGHRYGPSSLQLRQKLRELDQVVSFLLHDLWDRGLSRTANFVLVSDHGMTPVAPTQTVDLRGLVKRQEVERILEAGAYVSIWPKPNRSKAVYAQLKSHRRLRVYRREEIPESWHYGKSHRVAPITAVAEPGWYITTHDYGYLVFGPRKTPALGLHGYQADHPDMWG